MTAFSMQPPKQTVPEPTIMLGATSFTRGREYSGVGRFKASALEAAGGGHFAESFSQAGTVILLACGCTARIYDGGFSWRVLRGGFPNVCAGAFVGDYAAPVDSLLDAADRAVDDLVRDHQYGSHR